MEVNKKKMDQETKMKLIYSIELGVFAVVFLVLGILELTKVITLSNTYQNIFKWVTIFGGTWLVIDLCWAIASRNRRKRIALIDKIIMVPLGIYLIIFDIYGLANSSLPYDYYRFGMSIPFIYISLAYAFQGIYHFYNPVPGLFEDIKNEEEKENKVENIEPNNDEEVALEEDNNKNV